MTRPRKWTRYAANAVQALIAILALTLAIRALRKQWSNSSLELSHLHPAWGWIALSGILFLVTYAVLIETWREVLRAWQTRLRFIDAARIWSITNLYRYIPGKVFQIPAMAIMARQANAKPIPATGSAILNVAVNLI